MKMKKSIYNKMSIEILSGVPVSNLLASSVVTNETVLQSVGQELGPVYDLSSDTDATTGKTFNHEWEQGE